jgi:hypothetical protein
MYFAYILQYFETLLVIISVLLYSLGTPFLDFRIRVQLPPLLAIHHYTRTSIDPS